LVEFLGGWADAEEEGDFEEEDYQGEDSVGGIGLVAGILRANEGGTPVGGRERLGWEEEEEAW